MRNVGLRFVSGSRRRSWECFVVSVCDSCTFVPLCLGTFGPLGLCAPGLGRVLLDHMCCGLAFFLSFFPPFCDVAYDVA